MKELTKLDVCPQGKFNAWAEGRRYFIAKMNKIERDDSFEVTHDNTSEFLNKTYTPAYFGDDGTGVFVFRLSRNLYAYYAAYSDQDLDVTHGTMDEAVDYINAVLEEIENDKPSID